jgi:hypothetical protein
MCTLIGCPGGLAGGAFTVCCNLQRDPPLVVFRGVDATMICVFFFLLLISFSALYIPLTFLCTQADGVSWKIYPDRGKCWGGSDGGDWLILGLAAGSLMGFATVGLVVAVCRSYLSCCRRGRRTPHDDGDIKASPSPLPK